MKKSFLTIAIGLSILHVALSQKTIEKETFVYAQKDGIDLHLDKYVDNSVPWEGKRPVMIYVHGGGFSMGSRINALQIKYNKHFTSKGYVSISIDYRKEVNPEVPADQATVLKAISSATEDLLDATAYILSHAASWNIDPEKIVISGGSAGAVTCLHAEYQIVNQGPLTERLPKGFNYAGIISQAGCIVVPGDSLTWKTPPSPMLLMHGNKDQQVPFDNYSIEGNLYAGSNYIHHQLEAMNVSHWLYEENGADHIVALKPLQYNFGEIDTFLDTFVMQGKQAMAHTIWTDEAPDTMDKMFDVVPLYMIGWEKTDEEVEAGNN